MEEWAMVGTATAMIAAAWDCEMETVGGVPEVDPIPEALMAAAVAAAEAAGKLPRAAGTRGVRKTPEKELGYCHFDLRKMPGF
jgi:hypothetical protein